MLRRQRNDISEHRRRISVPRAAATPPPAEREDRSAALRPAHAHARRTAPTREPLPKVTLTRTHTLAVPVDRWSYHRVPVRHHPRRWRSDARTGHRPANSSRQQHTTCSILSKPARPTPPPHYRCRPHHRLAPSLAAAPRPAVAAYLPRLSPSPAGSATDTDTGERGAAGRRFTAARWRHRWCPPREAQTRARRAQRRRRRAVWRQQRRRWGAALRAAPKRRGGPIVHRLDPQRGAYPIAGTASVFHS